MLLALDHFLKPRPLRARPEADPRRRRHARGQVGRQQPGAGEEVPAAAGGIQTKGEHGRRRQIPPGVRSRDQMQAHRPPARHRIVGHQLQRAFGWTGDEAQPRPAGIDHGPRAHVRHEDHVQHPAPARPERPVPFGPRGEVDEVHAITPDHGVERGVGDPHQLLALPTRLRDPREPGKLHRDRARCGQPGENERAKKGIQLHG